MIPTIPVFGTTMVVKTPLLPVEFPLFVASIPIFADYIIYIWQCVKTLYPW